MSDLERTIEEARETVRRMGTKLSVQQIPGIAKPAPPPVDLSGANTGGDRECEWLLNALRCQMGLVYDADDLRACWNALGQQPGEMSDGQLAFAIIKSFLKFANG